MRVSPGETRTQIWPWLLSLLHSEMATSLGLCVPVSTPAQPVSLAGVPSDNLNNTLLLWMLIRITSGNDSTDNRISSLHKTEWHYVGSALALAHLFIVQCRPRLHKHVNINFKVAMSLMFGMFHSLHWTFTFAPTSDSL